MKDLSHLPQAGISHSEVVCALNMNELYLLEYCYKKEVNFSPSCLLVGEQGSYVFTA